MRSLVPFLLVAVALVSCGKKQNPPAVAAKAPMQPNVSTQAPTTGIAPQPVTARSQPKLSHAVISVNSGGSVKQVTEPRSGQKSLLLIAGNTNVNQASIRLPNVAGKALAGLQGIQYNMYLPKRASTLNSDTNSVNANIGVDLNCDGKADDTLVLEPWTMQAQATIALREWITVRLNNTSGKVLSSENDSISPVGPVILPGSRSDLQKQGTLVEAIRQVGAMQSCQAKITHIDLSLGSMNDRTLNGAEAFINDVKLQIGGELIEYSL